MSRITQLNWTHCKSRAKRIANHIEKLAANKVQYVSLYGVPRGGVPAALLVHSCLRAMGWHVALLEDIAPQRTDNVYVIDDILDSGETRKRYKNFPFFALVDKGQEPELLDHWVEFPWERMSQENGCEDNIRRILQHIGEDPNREGLLETPKRVAQSYDQLFGGYKQDPAALFKTFDSDGYDEMIVLDNIEFYSCCEHHMQPFFGSASIAYIPNKKVIGVSKLARLLEVFSRRLQIQERLTAQIADSLMEHLQPLGAAVTLRAKHFCMVCRGVQKQSSVMRTQALRGVFLEPAVRAEYLNSLS